MQTGETAKMLFGRCPYCRAMIYQNPKAIIYYCSRCRTPIRGKNPVMEPEDEAEYALSRLEILSADTASVFSDEPDDASYCPSTSSRFGDAAPDRRVEELRPTSRRTRRPSSSSDLPLMGSEEGDDAFYMAGSAREEQRRRRSSMSTMEQGTPTAVSGPEPATAPSVAGSSRLMDPEFHKELLHALDKLRGLIVAVEQPRPASGAIARAVTRRDSRLFRRLESTLERALPSEPEENSARRAASTGTSPCSWPSSSGHAERPETVAREHRLRPILGGAPFVVCGKCSELLRAPPVPSRRRTSAAAAGTRLRCGGCEQVLTVALPAHRPGRTVSEPLPRRRSGEAMDACS